ncbi:MAG: type II toxin-antitoxin system VapC family toxin [Capsulimonadaceae bacterium]
MRYLLDTCTFCWAASQEGLLSDLARFTISDDESTLGVSIVSFWEMAIKASLGKWELPAPLLKLKGFAGAEDIQIVPLTVEITEVVRHLPHHHGDPFDRVILGTALNEGWTIISPDDKFDAYMGTTRIW